jgi:uncharacterized membrane protein
MDPEPLEPREPSPLPYRLLLVQGFVLVLQWLHYYPLMPARMATHFGAGGEANGWMARDGFLLFFFAMIGFMVTLMLAMPKLIGLFPDSMINLPHKAYWLAPERRPLTMSIVASFMAWLAVIVVGLFMAILQLTFLSNLEPKPRLDGVAAAVAMIAFFVSMAVWLVLFYRAFRMPAGPEAPR